MNNNKKLKCNGNNEKIKNKYYEFLKESQGYSELTINTIKKGIYRYEEFIDFEDFSKFTRKKAISYKNWLENKQNYNSNEKISITTCYHYLRYLKDFFSWLAFQPKYKSKINLTDVEFLKMPKEKARIATSKKRENYPSLEEIKTLVQSIKIDNEIDLRDRALISFTLLSGMRDRAIISLPIKSFDENTLRISQDPKLGVKTKFSKTINSVLFKFDDELLRYVVDWTKYLKKEKHYKENDPLFPMNKIENQNNSKSFISKNIEPKFWQSITSMRAIFKERFKNANLEYYSPHCFRHLAVYLSFSKCKNGQEIKAISQNFGHENIGTTMMTYGTLSQKQVENIISNIDFNNNSQSTDQAYLLTKFQEFLNNQNASQF